MGRFLLGLLVLALAACADDDRAEGSGAGERREGPPATEEPAAASPPEHRGAASRMELVFVGTGTPVPDPERSGPCLAVLVDGQPLLFDAGPGVVRAATAAGLDPVALTHVFLTHLHSDHTLGLPDLILTPWIVGRDASLTVWGPPGTEAMVDHLVAAFAEDRHVRTSGFEGKGPLALRAHDGLAGEPVRLGEVRVEAFEVAHGSWDHAFGYVVEGPDRRVVISGDTAPTDAIVDACDGCDVLVHEAYSAARFAELPPSARRYHGAFHTSAEAVGRLATRARAKTVVLTHLLRWGASEASMAAEVRAHFDGEVLVARDGLRL